ncbi:MAG: choice-of-anchor J domain-containing protein [Crocinitomicaceae bacterium]|nr:choice-of-anchor J domain-containing protein [Crocinitomicaceae bacterium]
MRNSLLTIALISIALGANAQVVFEDDFSGGLNNWNLTDSDGDGSNWMMRDYDDGVQEEHASSASWNPTSETPSGALTPDNWMISDPLDLTGLTNISLIWKVYAQDQAWENEHYSVYVATSNATGTLAASPVNFSETMTTTAGYVNRSLDLSSFAGMTVYVAFRHHAVTDMFRLNIDDVKVFQPLANDMKINSITVDNGLEGNRTFSITCENNGSNTVTAFDLDWSFDGGTVSTENVTGVSLTTGQTHVIDIVVNGVPAGAGQDFDAEITTSDDDNSNNTLTESFDFEIPVPQFTGTDSHGNAFDLHASLSSGQAIILDFMASWCGPCESSTPELSELIENNGSGAGPLQAIALSVESTDNNTVMNGLNWNGGFYAYPKFAYTTANNNQYYHYAVNHGFNTGGSIPFFVMICPNISDPGHSSIVKYDVGFGAGMFADYQTELGSCPTAYLGDSKEELLAVGLSIYPNPSSLATNIEFNAGINSDVNVQITNSLGQIVYSEMMGEVSGMQKVEFATSNLEAGLYIVNVTINGVVNTERLSVIK